MAIIWLPEWKYPDHQRTKPFLWSKQEGNYTVCSIKKDYEFEKEVDSITFKFVSDTASYLIINDEIVANANVKAHGDFLFIERDNPEQYWGEKHIVFNLKSRKISLLAKVQMCPTKLYDLSTTYGGFAFEATIYFNDGTSTKIESDKSWLIKLEKSFDKPFSYDDSLDDTNYMNAEEKKYNWFLYNDKFDLPIEEEVSFKNSFVVPANQSGDFDFNLPIIYSSYLALEVKTKSPLEMKIEILETDVTNDVLNVKISKDTYLRFIDMLSIGRIKINAKNLGDKNAKVKLHVFHSHTPVKQIREIKTSNKKLNDIFKKSQFAAINCLQNLILDSPKHLEPFASCQGDYQIISLVFALSTGQYDLIRHTILGNARALKRNHGRISNSSYALTFISWLWKYYMLTGDLETLRKSTPAIEAIHEEFATYFDDNGLIQKPYNYIFNDWLVVDGYGLFNPPRALGQSVFNMTYYDSLIATAHVYQALGEDKLVKKYSRFAKTLKDTINQLLFNKERGLYVEGLNGKEPHYTKDIFLGNKIPDNTDKVYFRKHANILSVAFGIAAKKDIKPIMNKVFNELSACEIQPYFQYYNFQAVHAANLDKKYAMKIVKEWTSRIKIKDKGLPEGFYKPEPAYIFDFSHGWGCGVYYGFLIAASGLEIVEPGMKKVRLSPKTLGVKNLSYSLATPYGYIHIEGDKVISSPEEVEIIYY